MARRRRKKRGLGNVNVAWKSARGQGDKFANGPRQVAKVGSCTLEVFEWCSTKKNSRTPCPSGEFSYVVVKRGVVKAAGPHAGSQPLHVSAEAAKAAAVSRTLKDPKLIKCRRR